MTNIFKDCTARENGGTGFLVVGDGATFDGCISERNGGDGFVHISQPALAALRKIGLPEDTDPSEVAELLDHLRSVDAAHRERAAAESGLIEKLKRKGMNALALVGIFATIASEPQVQTLIKHLLQK